MKSFIFKTIFFSFLIICTGCTTLNQKTGMSADQTAEKFFNQIQRSHRQEAYALLSWQLTQSISYEQFDQLLDVIENNWGRIEETQTVVMPFHERLGEEKFLSSKLAPDQIKRYIFEIKFEHAQINCDLTLAQQAGEYKIYWMSFWGSSVYMKPEIQQKMEELFSDSKPE